MDTSPLACILGAMPPARSTRLPAAVLAATVLLGAAGLTACAGPVVDGPVEPIVMTEADGVLRGPDEGASPVRPPDPAPAGDPTPGASSGQEEDRQEIETATTAPPPAADDDHVPPPPPPPAVTDDDEHRDDEDDHVDSDDDPDPEDDPVDETEEPDTDDDGDEEDEDDEADDD